MNFNQLKAIANECVFSIEGITVMKTEEYNYRLQQISQLTNNWNELEEYILNHYIVGHTIQNASLDDILRKMKEIKEGSNE